MSKSKNTPETNAKKKPGLFEPGGPGGPGRPQGSRNAATIALDKIADAAGEDILNAMVGAAKGGDMRAAELVLQRIWPARKSRPIALTLPAIQSASDVVAAVGAIADAVGAGEITPDEGQAVASILEAKRRAIETVDLEARLSALEQGAEMSLDSRLAKIELERRPDGVACVWRNVGETADAAIARWMAARPGEPDPRKTSAVVLMISWGSH